MFDFDSREEILWAMVKPGVWRHHVLLIDASSFMGKSSINDIYVPFPCFQYRTVYIYIYPQNPRLAVAKIVIRPVLLLVQAKRVFFYV